MRKKIVFLVSGNGGNLKYIYYCQKLINLNLDIVAVISDRDCGAIQFANPLIQIVKKINVKQDGFHELNILLKELNADYIVTNIHKILPKSTLECCNSRFINLHYSLLPSFSGLINMQPIEEAKKMNCRFIGSTCHEVNEIVDAGPIIQQSVFNVNWNKDDTNHIFEVMFQSGCLNLLTVLYGNENSKIDSLNIIGKSVQFSNEIPIRIEQHHQIIKCIKNE